MITAKPRVGDHLFWRPRHGAGRLTKVTKVGVKWLHCDNGHRYHIGTGREGSDFAGQLYDREVDYLVERTLRQAWDAFRRDVWGRHMPQMITLEQIGRAREALGLAAQEPPT